MALGSVSMDFELVGGVTEVERMLLHLDTCFSLPAMEKFMNVEVVNYLQSRAKGRFSSGGDDASGAWTPLMASTVAIREAGIASGQFSGISGTKPINVRTGQMRDFITRSTGTVRSEGSGNVSLKFPGDRGGELVKTKIRRAQSGDASKTVARPVLAINESDAFVILGRFAKFIKNGG